MLNPLTHRKILKKGLPARAQITAMGALVPRASRFNLAMTLLVQLEGFPPYEVEDEWMVSSKSTIGGGISVPVKVDSDDHQKVAIDWETQRSELAEADSQRKEMLAGMPPVGSGEAAGADVTADQQVINLSGGTPEEAEAAMQALQAQGVMDPAQAAQVAEAMKQAQAMQTQWTGQQGGQPGAPDTDPADDAERLEQLNKLGELHKKGVLTDAEFEEQKAKLLKEL